MNDKTAFPLNWPDGRAYPCFSVSWSVRGRQAMKRFEYGGTRSREIALRDAIALRARKADMENLVPKFS